MPGCTFALSSYLKHSSLCPVAWAPLPAWLGSLRDGGIPSLRHRSTTCRNTVISERLRSTPVPLQFSPTVIDPTLSALVARLSGWGVWKWRGRRCQNQTLHTKPPCYKSLHARPRPPHCNRRRLRFVLFSTAAASAEKYFADASASVERKSRAGQRQ